MHVLVEEWRKGKRVEDRRPEVHAGRGELRAPRYFGEPRECDRFRASGETGDLRQAGQVPSSLVETCELGFRLQIEIAVSLYAIMHGLVSSSERAANLIK